MIGCGRLGLNSFLAFLTVVEIESLLFREVKSGNKAGQSHIKQVEAILEKN